MAGRFPQGTGWCGRPPESSIASDAEGRTVPLRRTQLHLPAGRSSRLRTPPSHGPGGTRRNHSPVGNVPHDRGPVEGEDLPSQWAHTRLLRLQTSEGTCHQKHGNAKRASPKGRLANFGAKISPVARQSQPCDCRVIAGIDAVDTPSSIRPCPGSNGDAAASQTARDAAGQRSGDKKCPPRPHLSRQVRPVHLEPAQTGKPEGTLDPVLLSIEETATTASSEESKKGNGSQRALNARQLTYGGDHAPPRILGMVPRWGDADVHPSLAWMAARGVPKDLTQACASDAGTGVTGWWRSASGSQRGGEGCVVHMLSHISVGTQPPSPCELA